MLAVAQASPSSLSLTHLSLFLLRHPSTCKSFGWIFKICLKSNPFHQLLPYRCYHLLHSGFAVVFSSLFSTLKPEISFPTQANHLTLLFRIHQHLPCHAQQKLKSFRWPWRPWEIQSPVISLPSSPPHSPSHTQLQPPWPPCCSLNTKYAAASGTLRWLSLRYKACLLPHPARSICLNPSHLLQVCQYINSSMGLRLAALFTIINHIHCKHPQSPFLCCTFP